MLLPTPQPSNKSDKKTKTDLLAWQSFFLSLNATS